MTLNRRRHRAAAYSKANRAARSEARRADVDVSAEFQPQSRVDVRIDPLCVVFARDDHFVAHLLDNDRAFQDNAAGANFLESLAGQRRAILLFGVAADEREVPLAVDAGAFDDPNRGVADFRPDAVPANDRDLVHKSERARERESDGVRERESGRKREQLLNISLSPALALPHSLALISYSAPAGSRYRPAAP